MTAALHLHLFYPDVALELIEQAARLEGRLPVFVTYSGMLDHRVERALETLADATLIETPNRLWDLGPLLAILPQLRAAGIDSVAHLHTKKGESGYAPEWRQIAYRGLLADAALVDRVAQAFADDPRLMLAGPAALYKSAAAHMFGNVRLLNRLAPCLTAPAFPPADWGFFAGSFFWARLDLLERVAALVDAGEEAGARDGTLAHAIERLIGLAPVAAGGRIGLTGADGLVLHDAPGAPDHEQIVRTLVHEAERAKGPPDLALAALIAERNPLADYIRHCRDAEAPDPNPYFSSGFYNRVHADVFATGANPLHHYMHHGWTEGRSTGPLFDGAFYKSRYPDVTGDPLRHFLDTGLAEDRLAIPLSEPEHDEAGGVRRFYPRFDLEAEAAFLAAMAARPAPAGRVSIIMPAWNRAATIGAAIGSVLDQSWADFELIVIDDGSTDATRDIVAGFDDPRIRLIATAHEGVSAARNAGLAAATGDWIAYLDSDNRWTAWFLEVMLRHLDAGRADAAYAGIALRDDLGHLTGYRGAPFDRAECLKQNYVDLNTLVHARALTDRIGGFDAGLRRMVDWDLILRLSAETALDYAPFVGCEYFDGRADAARITVAEPAAVQKLIRARHGGAPVRLTFAIKAAAPEADKAAWGDWHFADSLAASLRRLGHDAEVDLRGDWAKRAVAREDVAIVLRGLIPHRARPGQLTLLWAISHPDQIAFEEYDAASLVYTASESHAALLGPLTQTPVRPLLQATDPERFHPEPDAAGPDLLFVGNSRGVERDMVRWAIEAGHPPEIHGGGWDGLVDPALVASQNVDNRDLGRLYAGAGMVLNDHWPSMRAFGYLSNRLFDATAAGGRVVSDPVPCMTRVFGEEIWQVDGPPALAAAIAAKGAGPRPLALAADIARDHSFDARARTIVEDAMGLLGGGGVAARGGGLRIHMLTPHGPFGPQSSATIRLLAPLTDDTVSGRARVTIGRAEDALPDCDICIVQRTAMPSVAAADALIEMLAKRHVPLVADIDDGFLLIDDDHPEADRYRPLNAALNRIVGAAAETWVSTEAMAGLYRPLASHVEVMPNMLDPRLWRDWRKPPAPLFDGRHMRLLYMGTHTHAADFALMRPALDRLWDSRGGGGFELTLIGVAPDVAPAPWLSRLSPPAGAIPYARFVRWLRAQGPFDIGLAPLADTPFNAMKSDVKCLDYAALGAMPMAQDCPAYRGEMEGPVMVNDWFASLDDVLRQPEAVRDRARMATDHLWRRRSVGQQAGRMMDRLEALVG